MEYIQQTKQWLEKIVLGLNLCPFAHQPWQENKIRYFVAEDRELESLSRVFLQELQFLNDHAAEEVATTLIIIPNLLSDFNEYLDFVDEANYWIEEAGLSGIIQIASFHPDYQFGGTAYEDPENFTNRSPFPMLHLLREDMLEEAIRSYPDPEAIPERNIQKMRELGLAGIKNLLLNLRK